MALSALFLAAGVMAGILLKPGPGHSIEIARLEAEVRDMRQQVSLSLLDRASPSDRLSGLSVASQVSDPNPRTLEALFKALDEDSNTNVRLAAVDALYLFRDEARVREGLIGSLTRQTSPMVQVALINLLADIKETRAADALKTLIANRELRPEVRQKAEWGLRKLI
jgi:HEAT repeat protein